MTLTIISHTEHYQTADGQIVGFGPTVTEINSLLHLFDRIIHIAMLHPGLPPAHAMPYHQERVEFRALPGLGGPGLLDKLKVLTYAPFVLRKVQRALKESDWFQFRAPTGIGVYVIPYLMCIQKAGWFKYAGNWKQIDAPLTYSFQRWLLIHQSRKVTINGHWSDQPPHCLTFENPCLTLKELERGVELSQKKSPFDQGVILCFVGRLEAAKGLDLLFEALEGLPEEIEQPILHLHVVGGGNRLLEYETKAKGMKIPVTIHGILDRQGVHHILAQSHGMVLPTQSEGFPKVLSEAMAYGCVPIVSQVSAISQYVSKDQGFLIESLEVSAVRQAIEAFVGLAPMGYKAYQVNGLAGCSCFSYSHYHQHLKETIIE